MLKLHTLFFSLCNGHTLHQSAIPPFTTTYDRNEVYLVKLLNKLGYRAILDLRTPSVLGDKVSILSSFLVPMQLLSSNCPQHQDFFLFTRPP
jgi:hypothetical protein